MAKGSGRFRNRKLGFKTRINVEIGVVIEEDPLELDGLDLEDGEGIHDRGGSHGHGGGSGSGGGNQKQPKGIQTGVDKDEEGEVHLQQVIASTAAYVARNTTAGSSSSSSSSAQANTKKPASAYIPTRSSTTLPEDEFRALYKTGYVDPISYIRFSDTVEDTTRGAVNYTMDEDDEDWLEEFNEQFAKSATSSDKGKSKEGLDEVEPYDAFADAGKCLDELSDPKGPLSEDDFEKMMELLESVTEEKAPMAHVDISLLPPLLDFDYAFNDILRPELAALRPYARPLYPHWRERRVQRGGKRIMPQLDYDESNEQNPYVCFRRRELKTSRKTRRSDQQNLERLVRLRNDLYAAHALMLKVAEREQIKLEAILAEKQIFEQRCAMREVKRKLGEAEGDEDLLVSRREKRRKREDGSVGALRLSLRKPDPNNISPASLVPSVEELQSRKTRNDNLVKQIERELQRKRQADQQFEDWTDSSYLARPPPTPARFWRSVEPTPTAAAAGKREALGFAATWQAPIGRVRTSFRKRVGRGGRIYLDRIAPGRPGVGGDETHPSQRRWASSLDDTDGESEPDEMDEWLRERRNERFKFDTDSALDFPAADEPPLLDDFDLRHLVRRAALLKPQDVQALSVDSSYLEEAFKYVSSDPDKNQPPPTVIGRPPPRPPLQIHPSSQSLAGGGGPPPANPAAYAQAQAGIAAQQSLRVQQQQQLAAAQQMAAQRQRQAQSGSPNDQMRRASSSTQGSPVGSNQLPLPQNGAAQPQWNGQAPNGAFPQHQASPHSSPQHVNGLPLPPGPQQRLANGALVVPGLQPNGANGVPATSRLSHPPFSNPQAIQLAIQQQQQSLVAQQQAVAMQAAGMGRPLSANSQQLPSRPGSSASSSHHQHSPAMAALALPPQQGSPHLSPVAAAAALNLRQQNPPGTPPPGQAGLVNKRGSPMNYQMQAGAGQGGVQAMKPGYGNFVQG